MGNDSPVLNRCACVLGENARENGRRNFRLHGASLALVRVLARIGIGRGGRQDNARFVSGVPRARNRRPSRVSVARILRADSPVRRALRIFLGFD